MGPRALDAFPRAGIGHWPTPLDRADRLRAALGGPDHCPEIWIKREDLSGLALGGNKVRKLDLLLGQAVADGAELVVTFGAWQSNHVRQTAAACARLDLECELLLTPVVARTDSLYRHSGNQLLDRIFGARVHELAPGEDPAPRIAELTDGRRAAVLPAGGSNAVGTIGYVQATVEWVSQIRDHRTSLHHVVVAVSTGGTYAGTLTGLKRTGLRVRTTGVCVAADADATRALVDPLLAEVAESIGLGPVGASEIHLTDEFLGPAYGVTTPETIEAISTFARSEGLLLDPVYTGKAAAALMAMIRRGEIEPNERVLFIHTGGAPALFAYGDEILA